MVTKSVEFLELEKYVDGIEDFNCEVSLKDLLELIKDIEFINHMYYVVSDEDFGYNDTIQFIDKFDEYLGHGECTLYRENADWDLEVFEDGLMVGDFATFTDGTIHFVLRLEDIDVAMTDYDEKVNFLVGKHKELV